MDDESGCSDSKEQFEQALQQQHTQRYVLKLYVTGQTIRSIAAIAAIRAVCEQHLQGRYEFQVIDITRHPQLAEGERIVAAPTLIKELPLPLRRLVGDMSNEEKVLLGLDLMPKE
ncbi:MAG: circadian clock protein KaiB [Pleurocapsa minor GSE-CHR-MK-17-07R]|jgi:circadian clock protein KaiB|nr:circadian clock protein KaiB [Pleurocapsa minor GSE-CHR-MK 17-07R]